MQAKEKDASRSVYSYNIQTLNIQNFYQMGGAAPPHSARPLPPQRGASTQDRQTSPTRSGSRQDRREEQAQAAAPGRQSTPERDQEDSNGPPAPTPETRSARRAHRRAPLTGQTQRKTASTASIKQSRKSTGTAADTPGRGVKADMKRRKHLLRIRSWDELLEQVEEVPLWSRRMILCRLVFLVQLRTHSAWAYEARALADECKLRLETLQSDRRFRKALKDLQAVPPKNLSRSYLVQMQPLVTQLDCRPCAKWTCADKRTLQKARSEGDHHQEIEV